MPDPNQTDPTTNTSQAPVQGNTPGDTSTSFAPDFQSADSSVTTPPIMSTPSQDTAPVTTEEVKSAEDLGSGVPSDLPPVTSSGPKKKWGGGKVIATILGFLVLAGGIAGGVILTQQQQDIRERAGGGDCTVSGCGSSGQSCNASTGKCMCGNRVGCPDGQRCKDQRCVGDDPDDCTATNPDRCGGSCTNVQSDNNNCGNCGTKCGSGTSCKEGRCVVPNPPGAPIGCTGVTTQCPDGWQQVSEPASGSQSYCNAQGQQCKNYRVECRHSSGTHCFLREEPQCGGTCGGEETPPPPTAQCQDIKAYTPAWALLSAAQLSQLKATDQVNFCVKGTLTGGTFDKAKFTINGVAQSDTSTVRPGSTNEFCQLYPIPAATNSFSITAQIHHVTLGYK